MNCPTSLPLPFATTGVAVQLMGGVVFFVVVSETGQLATVSASVPYLRQACQQTSHGKDPVTVGMSV